MRDLAGAWTRLLPVTPASAAVGAELIARWAEPHRRYHTLDHLRAVLVAIDLLAADPADPAEAPEVPDPTVVRLAAWFHDAVYDRRPGSDEERSAELALRLLARCAPAAGGPDRVARPDLVARLVRITADHRVPPGDTDAAVLCDADLAVLGGPAADYARYVRAIRAEYRHVPEDAFRAGRAAVLRRLLDRPSLYATRAGRARWEAAARANLTGELRTLEG